MIRVLIADDQELVRAGFRLILQLEPDMEVVGEAIDGREAVRRTRELEPDVVLMDIRMPELDGIEATRRLVHAGVEARILILTTFDLNEYERELEVLRLVASGLSNGEIASRLVVSEATVKTHVGHVLQKLRLRDRVQAVIAAYESGFVQPGSI